MKEKLVPVNCQPKDEPVEGRPVESDTPSAYDFITDPDHPAHVGFWQGLATGTTVYPDGAPLTLDEAVVQIIGKTS